MKTAGDIFLVVMLCMIFPLFILLAVMVGVFEQIFLRKVE